MKTVEGKHLSPGYVNSCESSSLEVKIHVGDPRPVLRDCWASMRGTVGVTSYGRMCVRSSIETIDMTLNNQ